MKPPGVDIGDGLTIIDRTPHRKAAHTLELSNGSLLWSDSCKLWVDSDRKRWVQGAAEVCPDLPRDKALTALQTLDGIVSAPEPDGASEGDEEPDIRPWVDVSDGDLATLTRQTYITLAGCNHPPTLFSYGRLIAPH